MSKDIDVFDKVAIKIKYQNFGVLKRGEFYDEETQVESFLVPEYIKGNNKLYIQGEEESKDNIIFLIDKEDLKKILETVNKINEKYGIPKRWRADKEHYFYYITGSWNIDRTYDDYSAYKTSLYDLGNYFQTEKEAQRVIDSKKWQEFWAKVRAGEIGG